MSRPRWHDVLIVSAILALFAVGVWSLWGEDVRSALGLSSGSAGSAGSNSPAASPVATGST